MTVLRVHACNKGPFLLRDMLANTTGVPRAGIISPTVSAATSAAKASRSAVSVLLPRESDRTPGALRRDLRRNALRGGPYHAPAHITLKTAVDAGGKFIARQSTVLFVGGGYAGGKPTLQLLREQLLPRAYQVPTCGSIRVRFTPTPPRRPTCARRSRSSSTSAGAARRSHGGALGYDPLEFRLLSSVREGDLLVGNGRSVANSADPRSLPPRDELVARAADMGAGWPSPARKPARGTPRSR